MTNNWTNGKARRDGQKGGQVLRGRQSPFFIANNRFSIYEGAWARNGSSRPARRLDGDAIWRSTVRYGPVLIWTGLDWTVTLEH